MTLQRSQAVKLGCNHQYHLPIASRLTVCNVAKL